MESGVYPTPWRVFYLPKVELVHIPCWHMVKGYQGLIRTLVSYSSRTTTINIKDKPWFKKGLSHRGESSSSKGLSDRDIEPKVKRNNKVDTPQERPPCRKCGKLHRGECMMGSNARYNCGKPGHMMKDCSNMRGQEKKEGESSA